MNRSHRREHRGVSFRQIEPDRARTRLTLTHLAHLPELVNFAPRGHLARKLAPILEIATIATIALATSARVGHARACDWLAGRLA